MLTRMLQRRGTTAQWNDVQSTLVLSSGEIGIVFDTPDIGNNGKFKVGDGVTTWANLSFYLKDSQNDDIYSKLSASQTFTGSNIFQASSNSSIPVTITGIVGQSAVLLRIRDSNDSTLASIDATGKISAVGAAFTSTVTMASNKITGLGTPTADADAATKLYVDQAIAGLAWKAPVNLVSASGLDTYINVPTGGNTGTLVLDGHDALTQANGNGYRLLLLAQTDPVENGIYVYSDNGTTYTLARSVDADSLAELKGASVFVQEGTNYGTSSWVQTNHYISDFDEQDWVQFNGASQIVADGGLTKVGNTIAVGAGSGIQVNTNDIAIASGGVTSDMIATETIVNGDISPTAAIDKTKISGTAVTEADTGTVTSTMIANNTIVNADINTAADIAPSKISGTAVTQADTQTVTSTMIANGTIVNGDINASAAIDQSKIANLTTDLAGKSDTTHTHAIDDLSDVVITGSPVTRQVIKFNGTNWVNELPSGGISVGSTAPEGASSGDAWMDSNDGSLYVYYNDGVGSPSSQWVQVKANSALEASILTRMSAVESRATKIEAANAVRVANQSERTALYPAPVQGNTVFRADLGYEEKYYEAYNATTNPDGTTGAVGWYRYAGGALLSPNAFINADFSINQRGFTSTTTTGSYGFDRWKVDGGGGTITYSAQAFATGNAIPGYEPTSYARVITTGQSGTGSDFAMFRQNIEDVRTFAGQTVTYSFWAKAASGTPKLALEIEQNFGSGGSPSTAVTTYGGQVTLSTSWTRYSLTVNVPSITGKTIGTTANNSHVLATLFMSAGSTWNARSGSLGVQSNTFDFWGMQIESGPVATPFRRNQPNPQAELAACQRYYWRTGYGDLTGAAFTTPLAQANNYSGTQLECVVQFPVQMRKYPALDISSVSNQFRFYRNSGSDDFTSFTLGATSSLFAELYNTTEISGTAGQAGFVMFNVAGSYVGFSAEL